MQTAARRSCLKHREPAVNRRTKPKSTKKSNVQSRPTTSADIAYFELSLINAEGQPADEPDCQVAFLDTQQRTVVGARHVVFPGMRRFALPAWPTTGAVYCDITPNLYNMVKSKFFTPLRAEPQS